jgi:hypothetical protein
MDPMSSSESFQCFLTPSPEIPYSREYFTRITFEDALNLTNIFPKSLPKGSVVTWSFDNTVHNTPQALNIQPLELIPHYDDIRNIIELMPQAYAELARSVNLTLSIPGASPWEVTYHFSKVCRIISHIFRLTDL